MTDISLRPDIIYPSDLLQGDKNTPDNSEYAWHLLAEGDSWFTLGAIPSSNLLFEMRFRKWTQILNLGYPGDTIKHAGDLASNKDLKRCLAKKNFRYRFEGLLLSGGGNDLIDAAPTLIARSGRGTDPDSYIDGAGLNQLLADIQQSYKAIIELRDSVDSVSKGAPAFVHTYDYCTPRNAPARFLGTVGLLGPWLYKTFDGSKIAPLMQQRISDRLMDRLATALLELDSSNTSSGKALPAFHVIDTRNALVRANATEIGNSNDWLNEIHPNHDGYRKIASRLSAAINQTLV